MSLGMELGFDPGDLVLDGDPVAPPQKGGGGPLKFSAHVYCDQTVGLMKLILGMVVCISPGEFVLDGDPAFSSKGGAPSPILRVEVRISKTGPEVWGTSHCS